MKRAVITGVFGQDGSYLAELLSAMDYEVHGVPRSTPSETSLKIQAHLAQKGVTPILHDCNLNLFADVQDLFRTVRPDECYHLASVHYPAQTVGGAQLQRDRIMFEENTLSVLNLLFAIREISPQTRLVFAGSCLMYDDCQVSSQSEETPFRSKSLYGLSKITGHQLIDLFRNSFNLHASTAILYNHESPRRPPNFVTRKIVQGLVKVTRGQTQCLELGNLDSVKDWGFARDYARGMWLMAQADSPRDYILATGTGHTVEDVVRETADLLGLRNWREAVSVKDGLTPTKSVTLIGNSQRAQTELSWTHSLTFRQLIELMVQHELEGAFD
ncbi:MAG TPA: GDP-mannose 4,6-dehydratase [Pyrinomonadaceae bacterium]|nr:GDP-mannose 4,6-dehydratase [Pyrinomonadaceae bacterium]